MRILLDTNILVHAYNQSSPYQRQASNIVKQAVKGEIEAVLPAQIIYEFFSVVTNAKRVECPMNSHQAADLCINLWECQEIEKVNPTFVTPSEVFRVAKELKLSRSKIFDCVIAITAKENKVDVIYTENVEDFENYGFVKVLNPFKKT